MKSANESREQRRTEMPISAAFYAETEKVFGKPSGIWAEEGGRTINFGQTFNGLHESVAWPSPEFYSVKKGKCHADTK